MKKPIRTALDVDWVNYLELFKPERLQRPTFLMRCFVDGEIVKAFRFNTPPKPGDHIEHIDGVRLLVMRIEVSQFRTFNVYCEERYL